MTESPVLFYSSIILFAVISWAMYKYVLTAAGPHRQREPSSSTTSMSNDEFSVGDLVRIHGLVSNPEFNDTIGVVKAYQENTKRYEIQPSRGSETLAVKAVNLSDDEFFKPTDDRFKTERAYDNVFLWPSPNATARIPIQCFTDCPSAETPSAQDTYIQNKLGWQSVDTLSGIEEEGRDKPTFLLLFDGLDESSPENHMAMKIAKLLPDYKVQ